MLSRGGDPNKKRNTKIMFEEDSDSMGGSVMSFEPDQLMQSTTLSAIQAAEGEDDLETSSDAESESSNTPFSPPGWKKEVSGYGRMFNLQPPSISSSRAGSSSPVRRFGSATKDASRSRSTRSHIRITGDEEDEQNIDDTLLPANIPLPGSPLKRSPRNTQSMSPERWTKQEDERETMSTIESEDADREASIQPEDAGDNCMS
jgi:hypothetical protein